MANEKNPIWEGLAYFIVFLGISVMLLSIGWCGAGFPGLKNDNQTIYSTEKSE